MKNIIKKMYSEIINSSTRQGQNLNSEEIKISSD